MKINSLLRVLSINITLILMSCNNIKTKESIIAYSTFTPGEKWLDIEGNIINAHGGGILKYKDNYYWFGEHKIAGNSGNKAQVGIHCYSSADLYNWKDEGIAMPVVENDTTHPIAKGCVIERPKVIFNKKYNHFAMWFHLELRGQGYNSSLTGVAVSDSPTGPYKFIKSFRPNKQLWPSDYPDSLKTKKFNLDEVQPWSTEWINQVKLGAYLHRDFQKGQMSRDMTVYVDDDQKAYHIHASEENLTLHISQLTDDYLDFNGNFYRIFPAGHNEAPAIFREKNKYYLITSGCTGWDPNAARLAVADSITGNWLYLGNPAVGKDSLVTFNSQSTFVLTTDSGNHIFMADRWAPENPIDGRYIWLPIQFNEENIPYIKWLDNWDLNFFTN